MARYLLAGVIAAACYSNALLAQTGALDQTSPYPGPLGYGYTGFGASDPMSVWQQQVRVGLDGQLTGFELHLNGTIGSTMDVRIRVGDVWNTSPVVFQTLVTQQTVSGNEVSFVDCTAASLNFTVGQTFVIEVQGHNNGGGFTGTFAPAPMSALYPEAIYKNGAPFCLVNCNSRMAFTTYVLTSSVQPTVFCTAGTTSNGCSASISASGNPNVTHSAPCQITISNVEGQKVGIIFYGLASQYHASCPLVYGSSVQCVRAPIARTGTQTTGGSAGQCNGTLSLDWGVFQLANPSGLGQPWAAGNRAYVQGWFRDPPNCKTTSLSDAVELTYQP